jgi:methylmalonyl-CoA/ethylmalonyl-CoA epimerase
MISRVDHVSIAVREKDFDRAFSFFADLLGAIPGASGEDPVMKYYWEILSLGDLSRIEIITPTGNGSFLDNFLKDKDGGVHHINLQTPDIRKAKEILDKHGIPCFGFHEYGPVWKELFIHPRDAFGVLIQIAEFNADDWISPSLRMPRRTQYLVEKTSSGAIVEMAHPGGGKARIDLNREEIEKLIGDLQSALE